jgi:hypothetical protein
MVLAPEGRVFPVSIFQIDTLTPAESLEPELLARRELRRS